jgi:hypothetical protein
MAAASIHYNLGKISKVTMAVPEATGCKGKLPMKIYDMLKYKHMFDENRLSLKILNEHVRDCRITFKDDTHTYYVKWDNMDLFYTCEENVSVSTFVKQGNFPGFNADEVIAKMMANEYKFSRSKYVGMSPEEIKKLWSANGDAARDAGTLMHEAIERNVNGMDFTETELQSPEIKQYLLFEQEFVIAKGLIPYRTEWCLFSEQRIGLIGTADVVYVCQKQPEEGVLHLSLGDWKRSKKIERTNKYQKGLGLCASLDHCNYNHYDLALLCYAHMLENFYYNFSYRGKIYNTCKIVDRWLGVFHPDQSSYQLVMFENNRDKKNVLTTMLSERKKKLAKK